MLLKDTNIDLKDYLFWDTDRNKIDMEEHASYIIERVVSIGAWEDFMAILAYYSKERVLNALVNQRYLDKKTLSFCSVYFNTPIEKFRCFNYMLSNQVHWHY
jgi:hypothetical protein